MYASVEYSGHTVYTHPMQGPGTMGGALRCLEVHWAIIVIGCTVYLEPVHLRIAPRVLHFSSVYK